MNAQGINKQSVYTLPETTITIDLHQYGNEFWVRRVVVSNDKAYSPMIDYILGVLYDGKDYDEALNAYNQACAAQSFTPDKVDTSESGQTLLIMLVGIVLILICLYVFVSSLASTNEGLFTYMLNSLSEVIK